MVLLSMPGLGVQSLSCNLQSVDAQNYVMSKTVNVNATRPGAPGLQAYFDGVSKLVVEERPIGGKPLQGKLNITRAETAFDLPETGDALQDWRPAQHHGAPSAVGLILRAFFSVAALVSVTLGLVRVYTTALVGQDVREGIPK